MWTSNNRNPRDASSICTPYPLRFARCERIGLPIEVEGTE